MTSPTNRIQERTNQLFHEQQQSISKHTDRLFAWLMTVQWIAGIVAALVLSPKTWAGLENRTHLHVWVAVLLGGIVTSLPVYFALTQPGKALTRHSVAIGQMLMSALLIHISGGRIETHFHVFGSLAILAFYRDWRVLISASAIVYIDHLLRGFFWPQSVYGVLTATVWRSFEHAGWVVFEVSFLIVSIRKSLSEMFNVAERQATLEALNENIENEVAQRTAELTSEIAERTYAEEALSKSEEKLRQSQKMEAVGRLAGGVAHDFNNLLTVIDGYSHLMLRRISEDGPLRQSAQEIQKASDRAASLTHQLLALSRKQVLQPRVLDLTEVVAGMDKMLRRLIGENIELKTVFEPSLGKVKADPGQFEQVILNLAINARDAMPRGGKLTIQLGRVLFDDKTVFTNRELTPGPYIMLAVTDTGIGMNDEVKAHLFEPFFTTKGKDKGTGLGLATCYGIVTQSGGDIRVYSEPGRGTTFKVYLPQVDEPASTASGKSPDDLPRGTESILVVEDDSAVRKLAVFVLRDCGYQVQEASHPLEALALIEKNLNFDLIITDVIMPQMSGKELYDKIKVSNPAAKVLFISGYTDDALAHHGVLDADLWFLEKPFSPPRLALKVREVIDAKTVKAPATSDTSFFRAKS